MKGLLLGLFFATEGVSMMLSSLVILILGNLRKLSFCSYFGNTNHVYHEMLTNSICFGNATHSTVTNSTSLTSQQEGSCIDSAICAYIIFMMVALLSIIVFIVAACRYKLRKRDPDPVFPFWLYPENQERENACKRALRVLCFCVRDKDWQI